MQLRFTWLVAGLAVTGCGDLKFDENSTLPTTPPGSTVNAGSVSANIDGEQFFGRLSTGASYREGRFSFNAYDGYSRQISVSVRSPGPGTYAAGSPDSPTVSLLEGSSPDLRRWFAGSTMGTGSVTLTFLSADAATGHFSFILVPDSATVASGVSRPRSVTSGTFTVNVSR
jgi:hypothetical protein